MDWEYQPETVTRMAGFCSCKTCTSTVRGGRMRGPSPHGWAKFNQHGACLRLVLPIHVSDHIVTRQPLSYGQLATICHPVNGTAVL